MKRVFVSISILLGFAVALPALAQFGHKDADEAWADKPMSMAGIQREPEISKVAVLNLAHDTSRPDHAVLAARLPDALSAHLAKEKLAEEAPRRNRAFELEELGLPKFDSRDDVVKFAADVGTDAMLCGDVSLVGDATRVRLVLAELDHLLFYPPVNIYCTDPSAIDAIGKMVCRAFQSFLKAEDLRKELTDTWQAPEAGKLRFEARPNVSRVPAGQPCTIFVRFEFAAGEFAASDRAPLNVAIVLDRSGSMQGEKIEQAKQAAIRVVEGLARSDRLSFVIYNHEIEAPIPNRRASAKERIIELIKGIVADGYTNLGGGLQEGYKQARKSLDNELVNRAILLSDGLANRGETRADVLADWARQQYREDLSTSTIGIGTDYDAKLMEKIAVAGNGGYYYVQSPESINDIIAREFSSLFATVAEGSRLKLSLMNGAKLEYVVGFDVEEENGAQLVDVPTLRSNDRKFLIAKIHLPALEAGKHEVAKVTIDYREALADGKPAKIDTVLEIEAGGDSGPDAINWDVQLDAEELATTDTMDEVVKRLEAEDRESAIALLQGRIFELAGMSLQTLDLRSQVQCNILDGLITLVEQGKDPSGLQYALNNAQSISYGGIAGNANYQGLGQARGGFGGGGYGAGQPAAKAGFGGKRQQ